MGNSATKFNKSCILTGQIDSYCLACDEILNGNNGIEEHINSTGHTSNFGKCTAVDGHTFESIYKVPKGYYCQLCNYFIKSLAKVNLHVNEKVHSEAKSNNRTETNKCTKLKLAENGVVAFNCLRIDMKSWNAIVNGTCLVCDTDINDLEAHFNEAEHIINLIQAFVIQLYYFLYRKIDDKSIQCLTCNKLVPEKKLKEHFESKEHELVFKKACENRIVKRDVSAYNINKGLGMKNYMNMYENNRSGLCMVCNWHIEKSEISDHLNHYHHHQMLSLHNRWIDARKWMILDDQTGENMKAAIPLHFNTLSISSPEKSGGSSNSSDYETYSSSDEEDDRVGKKKNRGRKRRNSNGISPLDALIAFSIQNMIKKSETKKGKQKKVDNNDKLMKDKPASGDAAKMDKSKTQTDETTSKVSVSGEKPDKVDKINPEIADKSVKPEAVNVNAKADTDNSVTPTTVIVNTEKVADKSKPNIEEAEKDKKTKKETKGNKTSEKTTAHKDNIEKSKTGKFKVDCKDIENQSPNKMQPSTSKDNTEASKETTENSKENPDVTDQAKIKDLASEHGIKYKVKGVTTCTICQERVRGTIEDIKAHVTTMKHKKKFFKTSKISPTNYDTMRMQDFHKYSFGVNNIVRSSMILNGEICIDLLSYNVYVKEGNTVKCYLCNKMLDEKKRVTHFQMDLHKRLWGNCLIITSFEKELIREVKNGVYHCGFCNLIFTVWDALLDHLMSRSHKMYKMAAEQTLKANVNELMQRQMANFLGHMINNIH